MSGYYVKQGFGSYAVYDADDKLVEAFEGTGAKAAAEERATALNAAPPETEGEKDTPEVAEDYQRGKFREGRGQV